MKKTKPTFHIYDSISEHWVATVVGKPEAERRVKELQKQLPHCKIIMKEVKK